MKQKGKGFSSPVCSEYSIAASIALNAVILVMVSYVDVLSSIEPDPETSTLYSPRPDSLSSKSPIQCTIPENPPSLRIFVTASFSLASPLR